MVIHWENGKRTEEENLIIMMQVAVINGNKDCKANQMLYSEMYELFAV